MPFRERVKKAFGRSGSVSDGSSLTKSNTNNSTYAPGEKIPQSKYRGPVDPKHKERLEAFSFGDTIGNWRRKSMQSQYSPFGSRLPSRTNSISVDPRKLFHSRTPSHIGHVVEGVDPAVPTIHVQDSRNNSAKDSSTAPSNSTINSSETPRTEYDLHVEANDIGGSGKPLTEAQVNSAFQTAAVQRASS